MNRLEALRMLSAEFWRGAGTSKDSLRFQRRLHGNQKSAVATRSNIKETLTEHCHEHANQNCHRSNGSSFVALIWLQQSHTTITTVKKGF